MKFSEIKLKDNSQLQELLITFKRESFNLRIQSSVGKLQNTSRMKFIRRNIAKIQTLLNERLKIVGDKHNA